MSTKGPKPIDLYTAMQIKSARMLAGMSQEKLGEELGITFQQVQKYEKGTNRVSASRLQAIADITNQPITYFFPEQKHTSSPFNPAAALASSREGLELAEAFISIRDDRLRAGIVAVCKAAATYEPPAPPPKISYLGQPTR